MMQSAVSNFPLGGFMLCLSALYLNSTGWLICIRYYELDLCELQILVGSLWLTLIQLLKTIHQSCSGDVTEAFVSTGQGRRLVYGNFGETLDYPFFDP